LQTAQFIGGQDNISALTAAFNRIEPSWLNQLRSDPVADYAQLYINV
jgi:hypothetical protein